MPRAQGHPAQVIRVNRDEFSFDFRYRDKRYRGKLPLSAIVMLMSGNREPADSNLGAGAQPITLNDFVKNNYLLNAKRRLANPRSYTSEEFVILAVCKLLGDRALHEIRRRDSELCKEAWVKEDRVNSTIKKRLNCLRRVMECAQRLELIKNNPIPTVRDLPVGNRRHIWLTLIQIERLLAACHPTIRDLVEYLILTGARLGEGLDFRVDDIRNGKLYVPTQKQKKPMRDAMREFDIASLGPRFAALIARLKPHPKTGFYFYANLGSSSHLSDQYAEKLFQDARTAAGLGHNVHLHDLRGTFAMHRARVVTSFRQLQAEMGQGDPASIQSYLDRARSFDPKESIFFNAPVGEAKVEAGRV